MSRGHPAAAISLCGRVGWGGPADRGGPDRWLGTGERRLNLGRVHRSGLAVRQRGV